MTPSRMLNASPRVVGSVMIRVATSRSGPASQLGNVSALRGTSTDGPAAAHATTSNVPNTSVASPIRPARGPSVT